MKLFYAATSASLRMVNNGQEAPQPPPPSSILGKMFNKLVRLCSRPEEQQATTSKSILQEIFNKLGLPKAYLPSKSAFIKIFNKLTHAKTLVDSMRLLHHAVRKYTEEAVQGWEYDTPGMRRAIHRQVFDKLEEDFNKTHQPEIGEPSHP